MKIAGLFFAGVLFLGLPDSAPGALPPKPQHYVEDQAGILSPPVEAALNSKLEKFERDTSNQVLVATFPEVPADYQMEDFTQRTAEAWGVGQKATGNGAVLFLFPGSRKLRIEVGYGLEGAMPDVVAKRIIEREIVPAFRAGDRVETSVAEVPLVGAAASAEAAEASEAEEPAEDGDMKTRHFLKALDEARIVEAIRAAEARTSGEIRLFISSRRLRGKPVLRRATAQFEKLGMTKTRERNGVLIYIAPESREFAIVGDTGIHEKCGDGFWSDIAEGLRRKMAGGEFTASLLEAIAAAGDALASHFPRQADDRDVLPNTIGSD